MEERKYWDMEMEPLLGTPEMRKIQLSKLQKQMEYVYHSSPYHRERFDRKGIKPEDIRTFEDLREKVPLFTKEDWRESQELSRKRYGHSLGLHLCVPPERLRLVCATSGTTGDPTFYLFDEVNLRQKNPRCRYLWRMGVRPGHRMGVAFGLSMFVGGIPLITAIQEIGACAVPLGAEAGTERLLKFANLIRLDAIAITPSFATYLIEKIPEVLGIAPSGLGIRIMYCGGEPGAGIPEVRRRLEMAYGAKIFDVQAGVSCDYPEYMGMHIVTEDQAYWELLDPETKEPLPWEDGAEGELAVTTLEPGPASWVRYCPGDIIQVFTEPCPCGMSGHRYKIVGRVDDMLKVKGVMVYPAAIKDVIASFVPRVTGEFRIVLTEPPPRVTPPLRLKVEYGKEVREEDLQALTNEIEEKMKNTLRITPLIEWVPPQTLPRSTTKTQLIEKAYEKKP